MKLGFGFACVMCVTAACGGDSLGPGAGDDPGTGTSTLSIDGEVEAEPRIDNAQDSADFDTSFRIRITRAGQAVTTGEVTVESSAGVIALAFDPQADGGSWRGVQTGYFEVYRLDVLSGEDTVEGVRVDGPDIHWFDLPLPGATVDASLALVIDWDRDDEADSASIGTEETDDVGIVDSGTYSLAVGMLRSKDSEAQTERLDLRRSARVAPAGAVGGSELRVEIRNRIDLVVAPCPTCAN
jgi:hypothetical protein